ncbi:DUF1190 family protein [Aestuariibacter halophilus]|uniref:DUF1190 family protein n=1 Tax=Fluctibacter halophilus TaxID=226011 RepID=A0ABS8G2V5_9ALTE|nr:DUF1190 family protein [Aestuariibacter halophilus]MCC2614922.1 DUF1190 family protein [Aestuariibacter halophilus]
MTRKRSSTINLAQMRKHFTVKPLALGVASVMLSACGGDRQDATVYTSVDQCVNDNPEQANICQTAYQEALVEAERTAPKYRSEQDCEYDFGPNQCRVVNNNQGSFFMPFMAGFMLSNLLSPGGYYHQPMFASYSPYSRYRYRWLTADGYDFGDLRKRHYKVSKRTFNPKPSVSRTISRGGFGSSVRAKSSWGSGKSSWGG